MLVTGTRLLYRFGYIGIRHFGTSNTSRLSASRRWYSHESQGDKSLFSLDIDVLEWAQSKTPEKEAKPSAKIDSDATKTPVNIPASQDDILADFLLDSKSDGSPTSLDQLLENFANDDFSGIAERSNKSLDDDFSSLGQDGSLSDPYKGENLDSLSELSSSLELEERDLFEEMCQKYSQDALDISKRLTDLSESVLSTLQDSYSKPNKKADGIKSALEHEKTINELELQFTDALSGTTEYLSTLNRSELMSFSQDFIARFRHGEYDSNLFCLKKRRNERDDEFLERQRQLCEEIEAVSNATPQDPLLTVQTMPILFNHILKLICSKFYDGSLALTLFNIAKKDISLYAVLCNQTTYNEMLKVYWVFYGKSTLYEVELLTVEMMRNGFKGNLQTFAILKEILTTYHTMRMGKTVYNPCGMPVWSEEDERRARNLGHKLKKIGSQFRDKQFYLKKGLL